MTRRDGCMYLRSSCQPVPIRTETCCSGFLCGVSVCVRFCCPLSRRLADVTTQDSAFVRRCLMCSKRQCKGFCFLQCLFIPSEFRFHDRCQNQHLLTILTMTGFLLYNRKELALSENPTPYKSRQYAGLTNVPCQNSNSILNSIVFFLCFLLIIFTHHSLIKISY